MPRKRTRNNLPKRISAAPAQPGRTKQAVDLIVRTLRSHPRRSACAAVLALAVIAGIVYLAWPTPYRGFQPAVRTRAYTDYTACLLTDPTGITGTAAPVWAGMQAASRTTREQVSYLTMQGADTAANADTYINTLALRGCDIVLAAGALPDQGVDDRAAAYPKLRFITVGSPATAGATGTAASASISRPVNVNIITETTATATSTAVQDALVDADPTGAGTASASGE